MKRSLTDIQSITHGSGHISAWLILLPLLIAPRITEAQFGGGFVTVEGTQLKLNGGDFFFSGANSYSMLYSEVEAEEQFEIARSLGLNAIRLWGFWNGEVLEPQLDEEGVQIRPGTPDTDIYGRYVLQSRPGHYVEQGFRRLDYVVYLAHVYNMKLIIPLLNQWPEFGGIDTYLRWAGVSFPPLPEGHCAREQVIKSFRDQFWTNRRARQIYFDYVEYVLNRVNVYTGVAYKNDPAIMIWEIMNEPRYGQWAGNMDATVLRDFLAEAAAFIRSIDANHLISTGEEGFLRREHTALFRTTYPWNAAGGEGSDFVLNSEIPDIDVLSIHAWPFQWSLWGPASDDIGSDIYGEYPDMADFIPEWIEEHLRIADEIGKPAYLGEFGYQILRRPGSTVADRDRIMAAAYDYALTTEIAGMAYWHITASHDVESAVYQGPIERQALAQSWYTDEAVPHDIDFQFDIFCPEDETTCALIEEYSRITVARVENPDPPFEAPCVSPRTECGAMCILLESHPLHCGVCDNACADDERCREGSCDRIQLATTEMESVPGTAGCATRPFPLRRQNLLSLLR